jgi:CIC family chloride channel protein
MEEQREQSVLRVEDAMRPAVDPVLDADQPLEQALQQLDGIPNEQILVRMPPAGWTSTSAGELRHLLNEGRGQLSLRSVLPARPIPYLHPDHSLDLALRYLGSSPILPVVSRADLARLEGVISKEDVLTKYLHAGENTGEV